MTPLVTRPGAVLLPPRLFAPVAYYAVAARYGTVAVDAGMRFDKRCKAVHRYRIADTRGPLELTVPVARPSGSSSAAGCPWDAVPVSAHGQWWQTHITALESAYGRTPFFDHYMEQLGPLFAPRPLADNDTAGLLCLHAHSTVCRFLGLDVREVTPEEAMACGEGCDDFRKSMPTVSETEYWQVRRHLLGFIPGLSILDLIFNLGPEAPLALLDMKPQFRL